LNKDRTTFRFPVPLVSRLLLSGGGTERLSEPDDIDDDTDDGSDPIGVLTGADGEDPLSATSACLVRAACRASSMRVTPGLPVRCKIRSRNNL